MADPGNEPLVAADACELGAFIEFALESSFRQSARIDHHVAQMQFPILPSLPLED